MSGQVRRLTSTGRNILAVIVARSLDVGYGPTVSEICRATDRSRVVVWRHIEKLESLGFVRHVAKTQRSLMAAIDVVEFRGEPWRLVRTLP